MEPFFSFSFFFLGHYIRAWVAYLFVPVTPVSGLVVVIGQDVSVSLFISQLYWPSGHSCLSLIKDD